MCSKIGLVNKQVLSLVLSLLLFCIPTPAMCATTAEEWYNEGVSFLEQGEYEKALATFDKVIALDPQNVSAWYNKGAALIGLRRYDEGLLACENTIKFNPQNAFAWSNKGIALIGLGRYEEAIQAFDKAIELNPKLKGAWYNKGTALENLGRNEEAKVAFNKASELSADAPVIQVHLIKKEKIIAEKTFIYSLNADDSCKILFFTTFSLLGDTTIKFDDLHVKFDLIASNDSKPYDVHASILDTNLINETIHNVHQIDKRTFRHVFDIKVFLKGILQPPPHEVATSDILISFKLDNMSNDLIGYKRICIPSVSLSEASGSTDIEKVTVQLNLPNDPYSWSETIHVEPPPSYIVPKGRGESLVWEYDPGKQNFTDAVTCYYKVQEDPLRKSLDEATKSSLLISKRSLGLGVIAVILGIIAIIPFIQNIWQKLAQKRKK